MTLIKISPSDLVSAAIACYRSRPEQPIPRHDLDVVEWIVPDYELLEPEEIGSALLSESTVHRKSPIRRTRKDTTNVTTCRFSAKDPDGCGGRLCVRPKGDIIEAACERHVRTEPECVVVGVAPYWIYAEMST